LQYFDLIDFTGKFLFFSVLNVSIATCTWSVLNICVLK
jgi:hypothetical protein